MKIDLLPLALVAFGAGLLLFPRPVAGFVAGMPLKQRGDPTPIPPEQRIARPGFVRACGAALILVGLVLGWSGA